MFSAVRQVSNKHAIKRNRSVDQDIVDISLATFFFVIIRELADFALVIFLEGLRLYDDFFLCFHVPESGPPFVGHGELGVVENLKANDIVTPVDEVVEGFDDFFFVFIRSGNEIAEKHREPAARKEFRCFMKAWPNPRGSVSGFRVKSAEDSRQVAPFTFWGDVVDQIFVESGQPDGILLIYHEVSQRRGHATTIFKFSDATVRILHRRTHIHQQVAAEIRFRLKFLYVVTIRPAVDVPVDIFEIVAWAVLSMFAEFRGEALVGTVMKTRYESFDDEFGLQVQSADLLDDVRPEVFFSAWHRFKSQLEQLFISSRSILTDLVSYETAQESQAIDPAKVFAEE